MNKERVFSISSVGDVSFAGGFADRPGLSGAWIDADTAGFIKADAAVANLESVFLPPGEPRPPGLCLAELPESAEALKAAGINVVSLANNHILDYKREIGMLETMRVLRSAGIRHCGAGMNAEEARKPAVVEAGGVRAAVFSRIHDYSFTDLRPVVAGEKKPGAAILDEDEISSSIKEYKTSGLCDIAVLCLHWGMQNMHYHSPRVHEMGERLIEKGADLILGSHSHQLQGLARFGGRYCFYGQGNFYFFPFPLRGQPGGVLYGAGATVHRTASASRFEWDGRNWSCSLMITFQRPGAETVGALRGVESEKIKRLVLEEWSGNHPLKYRGKWRLSVFMKHVRGFCGSFRKKDGAALKYYASPRGFKKVVSDIINPPTLG